MQKSAPVYQLDFVLHPEQDTSIDTSKMRPRIRSSRTRTFPPCQRVVARGGRASDLLEPGGRDPDIRIIGIQMRVHHRRRHGLLRGGPIRFRDRCISWHSTQPMEGYLRRREHRAGAMADRHGPPWFQNSIRGDTSTARSDPCTSGSRPVAVVLRTQPWGCARHTGGRPLCGDRRCLHIGITSGWQSGTRARLQSKVDRQELPLCQRSRCRYARAAADRIRARRCRAIYRA